VPSPEPTAFERVYPRRSLLGGPGLRGLLWSVASSVCVCLLLLLLGLLADFLAHRGRIVATVAEWTQAAGPLSGPQLRDWGGPAELPPGQTHLVLEETGLGSTLPHGPRVWQSLANALGIPTAGRTNLSTLGWLVAVGALLAWIRSGCAWRARNAWNTAAVRVAGKLRQSIHRQANRLGPSDLDGSQGRQAVELFTTSVDMVAQGVVSWLSLRGRDLPRLVLVALTLLLIDPSLTLVCVVPLLLLWWLVERHEARARQEDQVSWERSDREVRLLAESLTKTRLVRGYRLETLENRQFDAALDRLQRTEFESLRQGALGRRFVRLLIAAVTAFVVLFLGWRILLPPHALSLGWGLAVLGGFLLAFPPLRALAQAQVTLAPAEAGAQAVQHYLARLPEVGQPVGARVLNPLSRMLTFEEVSYTPPGSATPLLDQFRAKIPAGRIVGLVSTDPLQAKAIASLLPRFIAPQSGRILIDGEDIARGTLDSLRSDVVLVGLGSQVISGTILENLRIHPAVTDDSVIDAARRMHLHESVQRLPQGYETVVGEQGEMLPAAIEFQLGLTRALLANPALLLIEEPSGPFEEETRAALEEAYQRLAQGRTVIFLPHRLSTLRRCEEILFLHRGRLAAIGPRDTLVNRSPLYRHWEYIHFNEFRSEFEMDEE